MLPVTVIELPSVPLLGESARVSGMVAKGSEAKTVEPEAMLMK